jgi:hypothetical protein
MFPTTSEIPNKQVRCMWKLQFINQSMIIHPRERETPRIDKINLVSFSNFSAWMSIYLYSPIHFVIILEMFLARKL